MPIKKEKMNIATKHNRLTNHNWQKSDQLTYLQAEYQLSGQSRLEAATSEFQIWRPKHQSTLPPGLQIRSDDGAMEVQTHGVLVAFRRRRSLYTDASVRDNGFWDKIESNEMTTDAFHGT